MRTIGKMVLGASVVMLIFGIYGCEPDETQNTLSVSPRIISIGKDGGTAKFIIQTDAPSWNIQNPGSAWVDLSETTGTGSESSIDITVDTRSLTQRFDTLVITAGNAKSVEVIITQSSSTYLYQLSANQSSISTVKTGGTSNIEITTDAPVWNLTTLSSWLQISQVSGNKGTTAISITVSDNTNGEARLDTLYINVANTPTLKIPVWQYGKYLYPSYNTSPLVPDATGMSSDAVALASKIKVGCNIGNTLEAIGSETSWGNPKINSDLIKLIKQSGFNAIRIPCSWNQYLENTKTAKIKTSWMKRVKDVIQMCVDEDMYVFLNIHWDGGWLENNCTVAKQDSNISKQKAFWEQIATEMRNFDEHLMFASANEPNVSNATEMGVLLSYHQTFVNAVRSTGGKNTYRVLIVQGPATDVTKTNDLMNTLPTDPATDRMMVEIHYYTPWNFCGMTKDETWGNQFYYWGAGNHSTTDTKHNPTWGEEATVDTQMALMKAKFVDHNIPVVMGEYGSNLRTNLTGDALTLHRASRAYFYKYVTKQAKANGILPFYWEAGGDGALFNRSNNTVKDQQALDGIIQGANNQ